MNEQPRQLTLEEIEAYLEENGQGAVKATARVLPNGHVQIRSVIRS